MRSEEVTTTTMPRTDAAGATLTKWGGWVCVFIGVGHSAIGIVMTWAHWPGWASGDLWGGFAAEGTLHSKLAFWSIPGGFAVPLILFGLLVVGRAREGRTLPRYLGWAMLGWASFCGYVTFPHGFLQVFVPAILFLVDSRRSRRAADTTS